MESKELIESAAAWLRNQLYKWNYEILNEAELCHFFFAAMLQQCQESEFPVCVLAAEIPLPSGGSIDLGVRSLNSGKGFESLIEAKVWIRPVGVSAWSKSNQQTVKRNQCIKDAKRLRSLLQSGMCRNAALLILERGSTHLRRLLGDELCKVELDLEQQWFNLERPSVGRREEHLGLVWLHASQSPQRPSIGRIFA